MNLDNYKEDILQKQYEELLRKGQEAQEEGNGKRAAKAFAEAANRREQLADIRDADYSDDIEKLRTAATQLRQGKPVTAGSSPDPDEGGTRRRSPGEDDDEEAFQEQVESFITQTDVTWEDIGGLEDVKSELKRTIALGGVTDKPEAVAATDRVLMFGPPGTGKTLLASAIAGSLDATFFDVKLGGLLSKYFGETSKQITALFDLAEEMSPSVIFLDEIDALTQSRESDLDETSRRVLNTLLSELDGIDKGSESFTMVLGATNTPWDLDQAIRRRFPRRILIPLPDVEAASEIARIHTIGGGVEFDGEPGAFLVSDGHPTPESPVDAIATECVDREFTGSDVEAVCRTAINSMIERSNENLETVADQGFEAVREYDLTVDAIRPQDIQDAFEQTSASLSRESVERFDEWDEEYGSGTGS